MARQVQTGSDPKVQTWQVTDPGQDGETQGTAIDWAGVRSRLGDPDDTAAPNTTDPATVNSLMRLQANNLGATTEAKPADTTAKSGLNGLLRFLSDVATAISDKLPDLINDLIPVQSRLHDGAGVALRSSTTEPPSDERGLVVRSIPQALGTASPPTGQIALTTANTAEQLPNIPVKFFAYIGCKSDSPGSIFIGDNTVTTTSGFEIPKSVSKPQLVSNLNQIWFNGANVGDTITYEVF